MATKVNVGVTAKKAKRGFKFGCDPELFVFRKGELVSAHDLLPGTKRDPFKVKQGAVQVDGTAAEFNTDPASTFEEFNDNIETVLSELRALLPKDAELRAVSAVRFTKEVFDKLPPVARELGCSPDFDAWTGRVNPPPHLPNDPYLRTASGHLHIGWTDDGDMASLQHILACQDLVKQLDWYLGSWSLAKDPDNTRRSLYGKAGACRYKPYGVEYRVLSNFWVLDPSLRLAVWNRMVSAISGMRNGFLPNELPKDLSEMLVRSINTGQMDPFLNDTAIRPLGLAA